MTFRREIAPGVVVQMFELDDAPVLYAAVERNRAYLRQWLPWVDRTRSALDVRDFIAQSREKFLSSQSPDAAIWVDGRLGGSIGSHLIDWPNRSTSIGYWIDPGLQGRGLITRSCTAMLDYLFGDLALHRVEIRCGTGNTRSGAIPARLGFTREGVAREAQWVSERWVDMVVWSMLEPEWRVLRSQRE
jgi:ribosomal-protein-serine acetyltransferase